MNLKPIRSGTRPFTDSSIADVAQRRPSRHAVLVAMFLGGVPAVAPAQELEPRAYAPAPVGVNFSGIAYLRSSGGVSVDPSLPLKNVDAQIETTSLFYARTLGFLGRSASVGFVLPRVSGTVKGEVAEQQREVTRTGLADPRLRLAVNLIGGPALDAKEFATRTPSTALGASLTVVAPFGQYDSSRLINLGSNRWAFKPELGLYQPLGPWSLELYGGAWFFTENKEFFGGSRRKQEPVATVQAHVAYTFRPQLWLSADVTYYTGGETTVDGVRKADMLKNSRVGLTLSLPIARQHSLKLAWTKGLTTRVGADFTTYALSWQYTWFD